MDFKQAIRMKALNIINDAPYGSEKANNALRLAIQMHKDHENTDLTVFLMADAVGTMKELTQLVMKSDKVVTL